MFFKKILFLFSAQNPSPHKTTLSNLEEVKKSPDEILRYLRYSTDLSITCLFDLENKTQSASNLEQKINSTNESHKLEIQNLKNKLEEKDNEIKEVARRMQSWKLSTAKSLAVKLEKKIAEELSVRRELQNNMVVENWLQNNDNNGGQQK